LYLIISHQRISPSSIRWMDCYDMTHKAPRRLNMFKVINGVGLKL
jgi:hypothetical protein